jgi:4-hydroxybenzoate polyprenyltransferase
MGAVLMRSAGCVINDYADRHFDPHVKRTCTRPIACGEVSPKAALVLFAFLVALAFALVLTLNRETVLWSLGALALAALYPFTKRCTYWPQAFLGAAFAWAIPMGFAATRGDVPAGAWLLYAAVSVWALIYDTYYAMVDREDDIKIGVKSPAVLLGDRVLQVVAGLQWIMILLLIFAGMVFALGLAYYVALLLAAAQFVWHQHLAASGRPFEAFLRSHWVGLTLLAGIMLA